MPSFTEIGWLIEGVRLLRKLAPALERLIAGDRQAIQPAIEPFGAEVRQIVVEAQSRSEAQLNDLRRQIQEQQLKLNVLEAQTGRIEQESVRLGELAAEIKRQAAVLQRWVQAAVILTVLAVLLTVAILIRH